ncbi:hypothetical protein OSTOST_20713 [Ostertagia ostertagi]
MDVDNMYNNGGRKKSEDMVEGKNRSLILLVFVLRVFPFPVGQDDGSGYGFANADVKRTDVPQSLLDRCLAPAQHLRAVVAVRRCTKTQQPQLLQRPPTTTTTEPTTTREFRTADFRHNIEDLLSANVDPTTLSNHHHKQHDDNNGPTTLNRRAIVLNYYGTKKESCCASHSKNIEEPARLSRSYAPTFSMSFM